MTVISIHSFVREISIHSFGWENEDYKDVARSVCFKKSNIEGEKNPFTNYGNCWVIFKNAFNLKANLIKLYSCDCFIVLVNTVFKANNGQCQNQLHKLSKPIIPELSVWKPAQIYPHAQELAGLSPRRAIVFLSSPFGGILSCIKLKCEFIEQ